MATDLERLVVQLSADVRSYQNQLVRANGFTVRQFRSIEQRGQQFQKRLSAIGRNAGLGFARELAGPLLGAASIQGATALVDQAQRIENQLKITGLEGAELEKVYDSLYKSALRNAAPFQDLVTVYSRAAIASKELGITTEETTRFVDTIAVALRVNGRSAAETQGALLQLSQALGSTIVRAEEFNSLLEGALPILQASARGLKEAEGSVAKLRTIMLEGKLTSEAFFRSIEAGTPYLQDLADNATLTLSQRLQNLQTGLVNAAREFNKSTKAGESFGAIIDTVAKEINNLRFDELITQFQEINKVVKLVSGAVALLGKDIRDFGEFTGLGKIGELAVGGIGAVAEFLGVGRGGSSYTELFGGAIKLSSSKGIEKRINSAFTEEIESAGALTEQAIRDSVLGQGANPNLPQNGPIPGQRNARQIQTVSLRDFATPPGAKGEGSGSRSSRKERLDDYERLTKRILDNTAATIAETEAQRQQNPLIDDYGYALERARAEQELLTAAKDAGKKVTPELRAEIAGLADQYALATVEAGRLAESQEDIRKKYEEMREFQKDVTRGIVDGFLEGKDAADVFADALKKIGNQLLDLAFNSAFDSKGGGGFLGNLLGGLFGGGRGLSSGALNSVRLGSGGLYADGGYTGPGGVNQPAGVVHAGEVVWSQADIRRAGGVSVVEGMRRGLSGYNNGGVVSGLRAPSMPNLRGMNGGAGGGRLNVDVGVTVDDDGALQGYVRSVSEDAAASGIARWSGSQDFKLRTGNIADQRFKNPRGGIR